MATKRFPYEPLARVPVYRPPYCLSRGHYSETRVVVFIGTRADNEVPAGGYPSLSEHLFELLAPGELARAAVL